MKAMHEALANERISATAGGGAVRVTVNGQQRLIAVEIAPEALADAGLLSDMLIVAANSALEQSQALAAERLNALSGGLGLPGLGL
jgi:DNA-binding protein YbaB